MPVQIVSCTGINQIRRLHMSIGHGTNVYITLACLPQLGFPPDDVTVTISDGFNTVQLQGCRIDRASIRLGTHGHIVGLQILGPTWKWKWGCVSGVYNVRRPDGSVDPETSKTPRELATLLFQAMKVQNFDVSGLPDTDGPFVNWRGANALSELTWLCHTWGCDFGLDIGNNMTATIWKVGVGAELPTGGADMSLGYGVDLVEPPDALKVLCDPNLYQSKLQLEPIMEDVDGTLKNINNISFKSDWTGVDPDNPDAGLTDPVAKAHARRDYLKKWRIFSQADGTQVVPGYGNVVNVENILPIFEYLSDDYQNANGVYYRQRAFLSGVFEIGGEPRSLGNSECTEPCEVEFSIDRETGIITTASPINKLDDNNQPVPAELYLTCAYHVRQPETYDYAAYTVSRQIANNDTGDHCLHRPELQLRFIAEYSTDDCTTVVDVTNNSLTLNPQIEAQLDAAQSEFQVAASLVKQYVGIIPVRLSGAVRQTAYTFNTDEPNKGTRTIASRNTEWEPGLLRRRQRFVNASARPIREIHDTHRRRLERRGEV